MYYKSDVRGTLSEEEMGFLEKEGGPQRGQLLDVEVVCWSAFDMLCI